MAETALLLLILFPFAGAIFAVALKPSEYARTWTLLVSTLTLALALIVGGSLIQTGSPVKWGMDSAMTNPLSIAAIGFGVKLKCDGISLCLVVLSAFITPLVVLSTGSSINDKPSARWFYGWVLVLLGSLLGTFLAADGLLFYFFFELTLIPSLLMLAIWGGPDRRNAAVRFFIFTFAGSIFLLVGLIYLAARAKTFELAELVQAAQNLITAQERMWIALAFLVGFLIKTPIFPFHSWQPLAYAESPAPAASLMASLMSKLGTYGLLRLTLPIALAGPTSYGYTGSESGWMTCGLVLLCLISIVYGGLVAWVQKDIVRLIAFSSLSHLGLCVLAILASLPANAAVTLTLQGAVMYMIAHGLSTAALLIIIGAIQARTGTRHLNEISGLFKKMPVLGTLLVLFTMASIGLPLTAGFVGEILSLQGVMNGFGLGVTLVAASGIVLGAIYMLHMVAKIGFGPLNAPEKAELTDANGRETASLVLLAIAVLAVGIFSTPILDIFKSDVANLPKWSPTVQKDTGPTQGEGAVFQ